MSILDILHTKQVKIILLNEKTVTGYLVSFDNQILEIETETEKRYILITAIQEIIDLGFKV
ncbi:MAG: hypothetical protein HUJ88_13505 [Fusobacterium necrophorum]|nr:hypothetical protein [Fusobacterium necrophorum]